MLKEFRAFIMRGNVLDLAVGVIIGAAFGAVVTSLVNDIIMPPIGVLVGGVDFSQYKIVLKDAIPAIGEAAAVPESAIYIGKFINVIINFLIVAAAVFLLVKSLSSVQNMTSKKEAEEAAKELPPTTEQLMLEELKAVRAALEKQSGR